MTTLSLRDRRAANRLSNACIKRGLSYRATVTDGGDWRVDVLPKQASRKATVGVPLFARFSAHKHEALDSARVGVEGAE